MAVKKDNCRLIITISKRQMEWIRKSAKKCGISCSRFAKFLLDRNVSNLMSQLSSEELDYIQRILRTPWIKLPEDD